MTQNPYDQLSKQLLEEVLAPLGTVQRSLEIPGEAKLVDLWFQPHHNLEQTVASELLAKIAQTPCLLEPYRNPPTRTDVRICLLKLLWVQEDLRRKTGQSTQGPASNSSSALLWIIATSVSQPVLEDFGAKPASDWQAGFYFLPKGLGAAFIAIDQLPKTPATLILRLLGRGKTQKHAIEEVLALSQDDPLRFQLLRVLGNWKVTLELSQVEFEERESRMAFSQAFLEWEQATEQKGVQRGLEQGLERERLLVIRQLNRKVGALSTEVTAQVQLLMFKDLELLGEDLLDFNQPEDLRAWLENH